MQLAPVAQNGQSTGLVIRRSRVQVPPGVREKPRSEAVSGRGENPVLSGVPHSCPRLRLELSSGARRAAEIASPRRSVAATAEWKLMGDSRPLAALTGVPGDAEAVPYSRMAGGIACRSDDPTSLPVTVHPSAAPAAGGAGRERRWHRPHGVRLAFTPQASWSHKTSLSRDHGTPDAWSSTEPRIRGQEHAVECFGQRNIRSVIGR